MNHCQFLTDGLLKVFLKEVINLKSEETEIVVFLTHKNSSFFGNSTKHSASLMSSKSPGWILGMLETPPK